MQSGPVLLIWIALAVAFIVIATARWRIHPFLVLLISGYGLGLLSGLTPTETVTAITSGFGGTVGYIGIVIASGTIIGIILERSGAALVMAETVVGWVGKARAAMAMSLTGAVVSIPVFCDSGYVILSPLSHSMAAQAGGSMATYAIVLSMGLYTTHVFVPPTPGPIAAAGELGADIGLVILVGLVVTIPVLITTYLFAHAMGRRIRIDPKLHETETPETSENIENKPESEPQRRIGKLQAFAPILLPTLLIALRSIAELPGHPLGEGVFLVVFGFLGNPNTALLLGVALAVWVAWDFGVEVYSSWVGDALKDAGVILLITGAGGALGGVLRETPVGDYLGSSLAGLDLGFFGILLPFLFAAAFKTTLGSSTVAIITTASIVSPLLVALDLANGLGPVLVTLAIGAGSMTVSHANDSYFWVVSQFSGMSVPQAYRLQTVGSAVAGVTGIATILLLRFFTL